MLEAMSCGLSGVCANRTSLPEVAGNTALLVDPENVEGIAEALTQFSDNTSLRESLARSAYARSHEFSTRRTAREMLEIFRHES